jgi:uncharacterized protein involved in outer membrane biogenesis
VRISRKHILLVFSAFALALIILVYGFNALVGGNREQVQQELQKLLGKDVSFDRLEASLWGGLGFSAQDFRIADDAHFAATPFVQAKELRLGVSIWQLFLGRVVINSLTFRNAEFQIITNEDGLLNTSALASRKKNLAEFPKFQVTSPDKPRSAVSFAIGALSVIDGRLDFVDRSVKESVELQVKNIDMEVRGLEAAGRTRINLAAAVTDALSHDVRIEGIIGPAKESRDWSQQPVELQLQFDSLYLPALARALPFFRNNIPRELNVTGPMSFQAKLAGTFQQPRLTDIKLKVPAFGSSEYNAIFEGSIALPESRDWSEADINGTLILDQINLAQLRDLPFWQEILPPTFTTEGQVSVSSRFEGAWNRLRLGALVQADKSEFRFGDWLHKPAGRPAKLRAQFSRHKDTLILHPSLLTLANSKATLSGLIDNSSAAPKLQFKLHSDRTELAGLARLIPPLSLHGASGDIDWDVIFERNFSVVDTSWHVRGKLNLAGAKFVHKETGTKIAALNASVSFLGTEARIENASFRVGSSHVAMAATIPDLTQPRAVYKLWSNEISLADVPAFSVGASVRLRNVSSDGEVQLGQSATFLKGNVVSTDGGLKNIAFRDLHADVIWLPTGIAVRKLSLQAFNGIVRSEGIWIADTSSQRFEFAPKFEAVDVHSFTTQTMPQLQNRISGKLDFRGEFKAATQSGTALQDSLKGSGEASIQNGTINDFNLIAQFLLGGNSPSRSQRSPASMVALMDRRDTPFDTLKANFKIDQQGILSVDVLLSTPEYTVTGAGWVKFDRTVKLNGLLLLSPSVTQEIQHEYKTVRYFVDRRGRLAISFRMEGTLPNVNIRPENRLLAQALRWGSAQAAGEPAGTNKKERSEWFPQSLEKLLTR